MFSGSNLLGWAVISGAVYFFLKTFRREVNGGIVKLSDKVKHDTDLPQSRPVAAPPTPAVDQRAVNAMAQLLYNIDFPPSPGQESGWGQLMGGLKWHCQERARARIAGGPYVSIEEENQRADAEGK